MFKFYEVGGCVRDEILGLKSKDIDYVAVPNEDLLKEALKYTSLPTVNQPPISLLDERFNPNLTLLFLLTIVS